MAERIARLYGPALVSGDRTNPTTLFTVPTGKLYIVRYLHCATPPSASQSYTGNLLVGKTNLDYPNVMGGNQWSAATTRWVESGNNIAMYVNEGESLVGAFSAPLDISTHWYAYQALTTDVDWDASTTTDAATLSSGAFTPAANSFAALAAWGLVASTKAASPDTVSSIIDSHSNGFKPMSSIVSAASSTVRVSIWGGQFQYAASGSASYDVTFGGTFTGAYAAVRATLGTAMMVGGPGNNPSTSNIVLQTATATGTTDTTQTVTMTPTTGGRSTAQILLLCTDGVASSYTKPTHPLGANASVVEEMADGNLATPNSTAAAYYIYPAMTNPFATLGSAGTGWAAACIEIPVGAYPSVTLSGVIVD